jgi:hypothetical protein
VTDLDISLNASRSLVKPETTDVTGYMDIADVQRPGRVDQTGVTHAEENIWPGPLLSMCQMQDCTRLTYR